MQQHLKLSALGHMLDFVQQLLRDTGYLDYSGLPVRKEYLNHIDDVGFQTVDKIAAFIDPF